MIHLYLQCLVRYVVSTRFSIIITLVTCSCTPVSFADVRTSVCILVFNFIPYYLSFFFNGTATTRIYTYWHTLSLHAALPISPDQQHVALENRWWRNGRQYETERFAGMAGGMDGLYSDPVHIQDPAVADPFGHAVRFRKFAHHRDTGRGVAQIAQRGDVVGVNVGVHGIDQAQAKLIDDRPVEGELFLDRIDDHGLPVAA